MKTTKKTMESNLRESMEILAGNPCSFWACHGPFNPKGIVRRKTVSMVTCSNCQEIIRINNFLIKLTGNPLTFNNVFPPTKGE